MSRPLCGQKGKMMCQLQQLILWNNFQNVIAALRPSCPSWPQALLGLRRSALTVKVLEGLAAWHCQLVSSPSGQRILMGQRRQQQSNPTCPSGPNHRLCLDQSSAQPQMLDSVPENLPSKSFPSVCLSSYGKDKEVRVFSSFFRPF